MNNTNNLYPTCQPSDKIKKLGSFITFISGAYIGKIKKIWMSRLTKYLSPQLNMNKTTYVASQYCSEMFFEHINCMVLLTRLNLSFTLTVQSKCALAIMNKSYVQPKTFNKRTNFNKL